MELLPFYRKLLKKFHLTIDRILVKVTSLEENNTSPFQRKVIIPSETVKTPELVNLPLYPISKHLNSSTYQSPAGYITVLRGVLYCPITNCILTPQRKVIKESLMPQHQLIMGKYHWNSKGYAQNGQPYWKLFYNPKVQTIEGLCCTFRGLYRAYFHTLITEMPRIWLLSQTEYSQSKNVKLLCPNGLSPTENYYISRLLPSNVKITPLLPDRLYYIQNLIFPSYINRQSSGYLPMPYIRAFQSLFLPNRQRKRRNRIFISRKNYENKWGRRHILNEVELFNILHRNGFEKYYPEELPIQEQIELFYDAEIVVGAHGSGLANILFSEGVKVVELNPSRAVHPYFYLLSKSVGGEYVFWLGDCGDENNDGDLFRNFKVSVEDVFDLISNFVG